MDMFLQRHGLIKLIAEKRENLNIPISTKKIVIKKAFTRGKYQAQMAFLANSIKDLKRK